MTIAFVGLTEEAVMNPDYAHLRIWRLTVWRKDTDGRAFPDELGRLQMLAATPDCDEIVALLEGRKPGRGE